MSAQGARVSDMRCPAHGRGVMGTHRSGGARDGLLALTVCFGITPQRWGRLTLCGAPPAPAVEAKHPRARQLAPFPRPAKCSCGPAVFPAKPALPGPGAALRLLAMRQRHPRAGRICALRRTRRCGKCSDLMDSLHGRDARLSSWWRPLLCDAATDRTFELGTLLCLAPAPSSGGMDAAAQPRCGSRVATFREFGCRPCCCSSSLCPKLAALRTGPRHLRECAPQRVSGRE